MQRPLEIFAFAPPSLTHATSGAQTLLPRRTSRKNATAHTAGLRGQYQYHSRFFSETVALVFLLYASEDNPMKNRGFPVVHYDY
jgi:hypothetical protein